MKTGPESKNSFQGLWTLLGSRRLAPTPDLYAEMLAREKAHVRHDFLIYRDVPRWHLTRGMTRNERSTRSMDWAAPYGGMTREDYKNLFFPDFYSGPLGEPWSPTGRLNRTMPEMRTIPKDRSQMQPYQREAMEKIEATLRSAGQFESRIKRDRPRPIVLSVFPRNERLERMFLQRPSEFKLVQFDSMASGLGDRLKMDFSDIERRVAQSLKECADAFTVAAHAFTLAAFTSGHQYGKGDLVRRAGELLRVGQTDRTLGTVPRTVDDLDPVEKKKYNSLVARIHRERPKRNKHTLRHLEIELKELMK